jgi:branched-chain amino acid transport system substrate-binding protein
MRAPLVVVATLSGVLLVAVLGACGPGAGEPVSLGAIYDLSGAQGELDRPSSRGALLAVKEANRSGGVLGRPVRMVPEDGQSQPPIAAARTAKLLRDFPRTAALFGLSDTDMVLAAAPVAAAQGRVFLTSGATSPRLPAEVPEFLYLACFGDNVQAAAAAEWAYGELGELSYPRANAFPARR